MLLAKGENAPRLNENGGNGKKQRIRARDLVPSVERLVDIGHESREIAVRHGHEADALSLVRVPSLSRPQRRTYPHHGAERSKIGRAAATSR